MSYFDNDYLDVPSYEFLQRYPKVYPILCLILRQTVSISGQIINIVILSDLMLRLSQKLQKQCLEAMLKCESRFMGRTWRDTRAAASMTSHSILPSQKISPMRNLHLIVSILSVA